MNTLLFQYAVEIEKSGSITKAAQNLYMAQPNLSKAIKDLETELGYEIFKRTAGGISVTDKGGEFLYHAQKMLEQMAEMEKIAGRNDDTDSYYKLSIPRGSYIANGFTSFVAALPTMDDLEITVNETNTLKTIDNVLNRGYNMGIIRYQKKDEEYFSNYIRNNKLEHEMIWEFEYLVVMSKMHPLARKDVISRADLSEYVRIMHGDIEIPHAKYNEDKIRSGKKAHGRTIYVYERGSQFDLLANMPTTYMWVSPIPDSYLEKNNLVQRACKAENNLYRDVLIYRKDYMLGERDKLFQKKLYESKVEVASAKYV
ncbi:MAG: LysR family transcriptional regulator [Clostridia bacterium]|nr:LysR family transcriptional regulator [Clostridia bacterium]